MVGSVGRVGGDTKSMKTGSWSSVQGGNLTSFLSQCKQQTSQGGQ